MRMRFALAATIWCIALVRLSAADPLTRPDASGHPLPEGEGREYFAAAASGEQQDMWQSAMIERIDSGIARMQAEGVNREPQAARAAQDQPGSTLNSPAVAGRDHGPRASIAALLHQQGLPPELTSVVTVESAFNPLALSSKGARGLWQLMPDTARRYGLTVTPQFDERTDPVRSTQAAAAYLKDLFVRFGNWPLALASYNAGEERVSRAMLKTGARDFWTLWRRGALPQETLQYVPAVLEKLGGPLDSPELHQAPKPLGRIAYATTGVVQK